MRQTLKAVYEKGVFRPLELLKIPEGKQVSIIIETTLKKDSEDILELAAQVYDGLSDEKINEIESVALDRNNFFRK